MLKHKQMCLFFFRKGHVFVKHAFLSRIRISMISYNFILLTLQQMNFQGGQSKKESVWVSSKLFDLEALKLLKLCANRPPLVGVFFWNSALERVPGEFFGKHWNLSTWNWVWYGWRCLYLNQVDGANHGQPCRQGELLTVSFHMERERCVLVFLFCCELFDVWWWYDFLCI